LRLGCDSYKLVYHPVGIQISDYYRRHTDQRESVQIVTTARLHPIKNLKLALNIIYDLQKSNNIFYHIIGDGPSRFELEEHIQKLNLQNIVKLHGFLSNSETLKILSKSDIYLQTSKSEVLPLSIMEASSVGLPVVSSRVGSINEIVENEQSGYLCATKADFKDNIIELINSSDLRQKMGKKGREIIKSKYDIQKLNKKLEAIYKDYI
jgi:colanic acid/amylovoran biosynthesis glycosyltransferase